MKILLIFILLIDSGIPLAKLSDNAGVGEGIVAYAKTTPTPNKRIAQCDCTELKVTSDFFAIRAGDIAEFRINSDDSELVKKAFVWKVSAGSIISGQGTSRITVQTSEAMLTPTPTPAPTASGNIISGPRRMGVPLTVTAELAQPASCSCKPATMTVYVGKHTEKFNMPPNVEELRLDKTEVVLPCPPGALSREGLSDDEPIVNVEVVAKDPDDDVLLYNYTVSGGKIIGSGADVKWDLSGVKPGTYEVVAGAEDGCGICGKTKKKEVTVVNTPDCIGPDISCPDLKLFGPEKISGPGVYTVTANISGASSDNEVLYLWTVTNGTILDGFGTPSIQVRIPRDIKGSDPVVTLQVQGAFDSRGSCLDKVSIALPVKPR